MRKKKLVNIGEFILPFSLWMVYVTCPLYCNKSIKQGMYMFSSSLLVPMILKAMSESYKYIVFSSNDNLNVLEVKSGGLKNKTNVEIHGKDGIEKKEFLSTIYSINRLGKVSYKDVDKAKYDYSKLSQNPVFLDTIEEELFTWDTCTGDVITSETDKGIIINSSPVCSDRRLKIDLSEGFYNIRDITDSHVGMVFEDEKVFKIINKCCFDRTTEGNPSKETDASPDSCFKQHL
eukprot:GHVP01054375.1.p1 GENE.GHVP01054375.1~~GHVP01054375.1.p1  ORF type:complete len:233 (+),score=36.60 GHVP01054375.1:107-805(+)